MTDMNRSTNPVLIIGSERSGTNLLRVLLSNHSRLHAPIPPHFLETFGFSSMYYTPLNHSENGKLLFSDMLAIANHPYTDWALNISFEKMQEKYQPVCFYDYFSLFYEEITQLNHKERYVCKELNLWNHIFQISNYFPDAKILYLYRDPRDYVASWIEKPFHINTAYDAIQTWVAEQESVDVLMRTHGIEVCPVSYEELVSDPCSTMTRILDYIGEKPESVCFATDPDKSRSVSWNPYWENLGKPINSRSAGKYRHALDTDTVNMIESIAGYYMKLLGYDLVTMADWERPRFMGLRNKLTRKLVQIRRRDHIKNQMNILHSKIALMHELQFDARSRFAINRHRQDL